MASSTDHAAPLAATMDEQSLRALFADAPERLDVPRDVSSIFRARMGRLGGDRRRLLLVGSGVALALGLVLPLVGGVSPGFALLGLVAAGWVITAITQYSRSSSDFFAGWASARGLQHDNDDPHIAAAVPMFSRGEKRCWNHVMSGVVAGHPAQVGHYRWTTVTTDGEGDRSENHTDFTVAAFRLPSAVAARFEGVYLSPKTWSFGALQDRFAHDRKVQIESAEFCDRYSLRVRDSQDDVALYELLSPPFVLRLATEVEVYWEQFGADLVVWQKGHEREAADLDSLCQRASVVLRRYLEEHR